MDTRSQKYKHLPRICEDIKMHAMPRSGCTCLIQVFNHLFYHPINGEEIIVSHKVVEEFDKYLVVTYRDFRDAAVSAWRIGSPREYDEQGKCLAEVTINDVKWMIKWAQSSARRLRKQREIAKNKPRALYLKYEQWVNDFDLLFFIIEKHFKITIDDEHRQAILDDTNINRNKERASQIEKEKGTNFEFHDEHSKIHAMHVHKGAIGEWKNFIPLEYQALFNKELTPILLEWGYEI